MEQDWKTWLARADEILNTQTGAALATLPWGMLAAVDDALATRWVDIQDELVGVNNGTVADPDAAAGRLQTGMAELSAICFDFDLWLLDSSARGAVIPDGAGLVLRERPPRQMASLTWPAADGGVIMGLAIVDPAGNPVPLGDAVHIVGTSVIDERVRAALRLAAPLWRANELRERRNSVLDAAREQTDAKLTALASRVRVVPEVNGQPTTWPKWLDHVTSSAPDAIWVPLGAYPEAGRAQRLWRRAAVLIGKYEQQFGEAPPTDVAGYITSMGRRDEGAAARAVVWDAIRGVRNARHAEAPGTHL